MQQIDRRILEKLPARLVLGLGRDEARQAARVVAWERLRSWYQDPDTGLDGLDWGYLATFVRWRVCDALDKQTLRWSRHVPTEVLPEAGPYAPPHGDPAEQDWDHHLGEHLDTLVAELVRLGMDRAAAAEAVQVACDDTDLRRFRMVTRLEDQAGIDHDVAQALADLLVGNTPAQVTSLVRRLALNEPRRQVVADPGVGSRLERIAAAAPASHSRASARPEARVPDPAEMAPDTPTGNRRLGLAG